MMLEDFGLEPERFRIEWIASSEAQKFADVMTEMTEALRVWGRARIVPGGKRGKGKKAKRWLYTMAFLPFSAHLGFKSGG